MGEVRDKTLSFYFNCIPLNAHTCLKYAARIRGAVFHARTLCCFLFVLTTLLDKRADPSGGSQSNQQK